MVRIWYVVFVVERWAIKKRMHDVRVQKTTRTSILSLRDHRLRLFLAFRESDCFHMLPLCFNALRKM